MIEQFKSSNGMTILTKDGNTRVMRNDRNVLDMVTYLGPQAMAAMTEKVLHDFGLWLDPETGALVMPLVRPSVEQYVFVYLDGRATGVSKNDTRPRGAFDRHISAAHRYFADFAPTPAHISAEPGEVWVVEIEGTGAASGEPHACLVDARGFFHDSDFSVYKAHESIRSARRIYPEPAA